MIQLRMARKTYVAEVEDVLAEGFFIPGQFCREYTIAHPVGQRMKEERFDLVQAKVLSSYFSLEFATLIVVGRRAAVVGRAVQVGAGRDNGGLQLVHIGMRTIRLVRKADQVVPIGDIGLVKYVGGTNREVERGVDAVASLNFKVTWLVQ